MITYSRQGPAAFTAKYRHRQELKKGRRLTCESQRQTVVFPRISRLAVPQQTSMPLGLIQHLPRSQFQPLP